MEQAIVLFTGLALGFMFGWIAYRDYVPVWHKRNRTASGRMEPPEPWPVALPNLDWCSSVSPPKEEERDAS